MPFFGAHLSIAGGVMEALKQAEKYACNTLQVFTKSPSQWNAKPIPEEDALLFRKSLKQRKIQAPTAHDSYLINLASPDESLFRKSIDAFLDELDRAESLGLHYLVTHPGAFLDSSETIGIGKIIEALNEIHSARPDSSVEILLETTAGQGSTLGHRFEHLESILQAIQHPRRIGICLDTCHVFAAGYDLSTAEGYEATFAEFDRRIGLKRLKVFHVNDSLKPLGSRVDRHAHLGKGHIGLDAFRRLVLDPRFAKKPMILETPKEEGENKEMDAVNLAVLRDFMAEGLTKLD